MRNVISALILGMSMIGAVVVYAWFTRDIGRYQVVSGEYPHSSSTLHKGGSSIIEEKQIKTVFRTDTKTGKVAYFVSGSMGDEASVSSWTSWDTWNYITEH